MGHHGDGSQIAIVISPSLCWARTPASSNGIGLTKDWLRLDRLPATSATDFFPPRASALCIAKQNSRRRPSSIAFRPHGCGLGHRLIYRLALEGDGDIGQMGVKSIVKYLNGKGIFTRDGGRWGIGQFTAS